jgi:ubiquinol oxidase
MLIDNHDVSTFDQTLTAAELKAEQAVTMRSARRKPGFAAAALFAVTNVVYGRSPSLRKFRVLEIVARVPYQAWEHVAYIAVTHTHERPNIAHHIHDRIVEAREEQDNEQWHLLIIEELLHAQGHRHRLVRDRVFPQILAFVYYQLSWLLYVIRPAWSYRLNADFEDHAEHTYMQFVDGRPDLDDTAWTSAFAESYGHHDTLGDLFRRIGLDERIHKEQSLHHIARPRFDVAG